MNIRFFKSKMPQALKKSRQYNRGKYSGILTVSFLCSKILRQNLFDFDHNKTKFPTN